MTEPLYTVVIDGHEHVRHATWDGVLDILNLDSMRGVEVMVYPWKPFDPMTATRAIKNQHTLNLLRLAQRVLFRLRMEGTYMTNDLTKAVHIALLNVEAALSPGTSIGLGLHSEASVDKYHGLRRAAERALAAGDVTLARQLLDTTKEV